MADDKRTADEKARGVKHEPVSGDADFDPTKRPGYQEYPKMVDGITVHSKEEEAALKHPEKK